MHTRSLRLVAVVISGLSLFTSQTRAAEVVEVLPLTNRILLIHLNEGHVIHHKLGEPRANEPVICDPLDLAIASNLATYTLTSTDDPAYATAQHPTDIGRKSKGTDYSWNIDWNAAKAGTEPKSPDHTKTWISVRCRC